MVFIFAAAAIAHTAIYYESDFLADKTVYYESDFKPAEAARKSQKVKEIVCINGREYIAIQHPHWRELTGPLVQEKIDCTNSNK